MKRVYTLLLLSILFLSCSTHEVDINLTEKPTDENAQSELPTETITLSTEIVLGNDKGNLFASKVTECEFPDLFTHKIPKTFNVTFIPTSVGDTIFYTNVTVGVDSLQFDVKPIEYRIVVTNSNKLNLNELPDYSDTLYLFGENTIDFNLNKSGTITIKNDYASVMVVNQSLNDIPTMKYKGQEIELVEVDGYYNIYTRVNTTFKGNQHLSINTWGIKVNEVFEANNVYRYLVCPNVDLNIVVDTDILKVVHDIKL